MVPWFSAWGEDYRRTSEKDFSPSVSNMDLWGQTVDGLGCGRAHCGLQNSVSNSTHWYQSQRFLILTVVSHKPWSFILHYSWITKTYILYLRWKETLTVKPHRAHRGTLQFRHCVVPLTLFWWECIWYVPAWPMWQFRLNKRLILEGKNIPVTTLADCGASSILIYSRNTHFKHPSLCGGRHTWINIAQLLVYILH